MLTVNRIIIVCILAPFCLACGQKGALYLPDNSTTPLPETLKEPIYAT